MLQVLTQWGIGLMRCVRYGRSAQRLFRLLLVALLGYAPYVGASVYLPLNLSPEIESRIERLFVQANMPVIKRPIPVKAVHIALEKLGHKDPDLSHSITKYMDRYLGRASINHAQLTVSAYTGDEQLSVANARGELIASHYSADFAAFWMPSDHITFNLGVLAYDAEPDKDNKFLDGSFLSLGWDSMRLEVGYRPHWFGPFQDSDMLISTHAPTLPSITLSNVLPFDFLGLRYEAFVAQLSESDKIRSYENGNVRLTGNPRIVGIHLSAEPVEGFAIGFNRLMQFGGADRQESPSSVLEAFLQPRNKDNRDTGDQADFGNQLSSVTTRYTFAGAFPLSVYMEYAGEDTSGASGLALGNTSLMFGLHAPKFTKDVDLSYEYASWQNAWYVNGNYDDGLRNFDHIIGHWGASNRDFEESVGAQSHYLKVNLAMLGGRSLTADLRIIKNENYYESEYETGGEASIGYSYGFGDFISSYKLTLGKSVWGEEYSRLTGSVRW